MSDVFYPMGNIESSEITLMDRTIVDPFEDGSTTARRLWPDKNFKRNFKIKHAPLSEREFAYLRSFFAARSGRYDYFWFRDNVHRTGNAKVRLSRPFQIVKSGSNVYQVTVELDEVAPRRTLVEDEEIRSALNAVNTWYDPSRVKYYQIGGLTTYTPYADTKLFNLALVSNAADSDLTEQLSSMISLDTITQAYPALTTFGLNWLRSTGFPNSLFGTQPAFTIFGFFKHGTCAAKQVLCSVGDTGAGKALGLVLSAANKYEPWIGGTEVWTNAAYTNSAADTWRSVAVTWNSAANTANLYVNGVLIGTDSVARSFVTGYTSIGASGTGTLKCNPTGVLTSCLTGPVVIVELALTLAQIKSLHNLWAVQHGLALV